MENLDKLYNEITASHKEYLKSKTALRNACVRFLSALPFNHDGVWAFKGCLPNIINGDYALSEIRMKDGRVFLVCKDEEICLLNEVGVGDLVYVATRVKIEMIMED